MDGEELLGAVLRLANTPVRKPNLAALERVYAELPALQCQGKCWSACGGKLPASPVEMERARKAGYDLAGRNLQPTLATVCAALDLTTHRCRVYQGRPMICRLWGVFAALACPWGCEPEGGHLDDLEAMRRLNLALWHGGAPEALEPEVFEAAVGDSRVVSALLENVRRHRPVREDAVIIPATLGSGRRTS
ncbi:YkgJ family cysteine cluster protein [Actinacidiphila sp. ITFR-21]|uniref:YkgJ family cysteine cluster protein n=1 Tax=Actinacidiphila sp. ITFR-21 TaxID=3075199 RepID=UPI00288A777A|nr:YkgJ family cysteine cluster protein [Streptomyces sp. ITFR-21]WNI17694.1 YkgJ family cysteine cluster protein [Streptomyces sp. ITFR-21]WNI17834.1 YkgJ family cysteine cluster protein [Streptomyces sp. ITFR-21]